MKGIIFMLNVKVDYVIIQSLTVLGASKGVVSI